MSHIQNIEIKNFKSIRHQKIEGCRRINVFVGPPNVGKSNILEALGLFSINKRGSSLNPYVRYEELASLFFEGNVQNQFEIIINKKRRVIGYLTDELLTVKKEYTREPSYFEGSGFHQNRLSKNSLLQEQQSFKVKQDNAEIFDSVSKPIETIYSDNLLSIKKYSYKEELSFFKSSDGSLLTPYGENIFSILSFNSLISKAVADLFSYYDLKLNIDKVTNSIKLLKYLSDEVVFTIPYSMIADTLRRLIFYKVAILSNEESILLFEEPEAHCYEPYIMEITNGIKNDENNNQFFIVTHSQYVIEELLRDKESRNETNIYLLGLEGSETQIKLLKPDAIEDIYQNGLNVFFNFESLWHETLPA